ncbi:nicotinate-nicotinamide nucleotide adenylyltransferase [Vibrio ruber]|uniref:nicotinate-nucleotide adenylyltransferase n=1 Tax=Vibrio ruber (strain DSM 16370 / JCM 11486 / BCRC 17186 / CECT 7878 / LMG 23124 / VR1) TaxID=1123498 RepID=A0A1R4LFE3_VIBR1|nr:nicotinate-nicotinamide nucleotide adenylyltransferase [Vibrio ruber]WNJ97902.1 nicotinate-nicotinamide nucleotide adenylyltransferase [Vibrio ruber]SJN55286.1 putative nicotinate-nucleotide adenylyltransferase [Vibrio ruber DSM 16370]
MLKIAVFGSAFNPPSLGHKSVIDSLSHFDQILLVPSLAHAWGKKMLPYEQRCRLVDALISDLGADKIQRSEIEEQLFVPGKHITTYAVLTALQDIYPQDELTFVMGPDNLLQFARFFRAKDILKQFNVMACPEKVPIRSTHIRQGLQQGKAIEALTTPSVAQLIHSLSLYH